MRPKGLSELEIQKICEFDWEDSNDEDENEGEEDKMDVLEAFIEESLQDIIQQGGNIEDELMKSTVLNTIQSDFDETVQQIYEKIDLNSLRWRHASKGKEMDTEWKSHVTAGIIKSPVEYFNSFLDDDIFEKICLETNKYAFQDKGVELKCEVWELRRYIGILLYLGVVKIPTTRMAWTNNFKLSAVSDALPRNRFEKIKSNFHINDNLKQPGKGEDNYDKLYKIRPLLNKLKEKFNEISQEEYQSCDEQMISFKGHHSLKQYLPKKPHKWGFKMFSRAGVSGIIYDFCLYVGDGTCKSYGLGLSSDIVLHLASNIPENQNFKLFFDNWFTSVSLMIALKERGILAVGTIRNNRLKNVNLLNEKQLADKGRGSFDIKVEGTYNLISCRWYDNKCVQLLSNYIADTPVSECM
ncbi:piggyBac transposable element-derived protein 3-like, partial [Drosophila ficusphila]|uniref:piggyBac transposable element-derived protein 3-like n=1 Tax=Drosophila ficusphila TaxID=30025 RepID=UPI001C89F347